MSDTTSRRKGSRLAVVLGLTVLVALSAALYLITMEPRNVQNAESTSPAIAARVLPADLAQGDVAAFLIHKAPQPLPMLSFVDAEGKTRSLADWQGKTVLLNVWATWCAPCREEMPALANVQKKYGGKDFEVVAISVDQKGAPAAKAFLEQIGVNDLDLYIDPTTKTLSLLKGVGLPTTILVDPKGRELGRLLGPAAWDSPDAAKLIEAAITRDKQGV